jgi:hypothetical protein
MRVVLAGSEKTVGKSPERRSIGSMEDQSYQCQLNHIENEDVNFHPVSALLPELTAVDHNDALTCRRHARDRQSWAVANPLIGSPPAKERAEEGRLNIEL